MIAPWQYDINNMMLVHEAGLRSNVLDGNLGAGNTALRYNVIG